MLDDLKDFLPPNPVNSATNSPPAAARSDAGYRLVVGGLRVLLTAGCTVRVHGAERTATPGTWILAANHISHFDPPLISSVCRRAVDWMAMSELFANRTFGKMLLGVNAFPVERGKADRGALREAGRRLSAGRVVGIFPEGGIRDGAASIVNGAAMQQGVAMLAHMHHCPVLPCVILGSDRLYNRRRWMPGRRARVWIGFGDFIAGQDRERTTGLLSGAITALRDDLTARFGLSDADLPHSPAERMKEP